MINYLTLPYKNLEEKTIDRAYLELLESKATFAVLKIDDENYILTKERSIFKIDDLEKFIAEAESDVYFKTVQIDNLDYLEEDLALYYIYLERYKERMQRVYGEKYFFGSVAVKTKENRIITTTRGKENFDEFTVVNNVDFGKNIVYVGDKKATLNAPLLYRILNRTNAKIIVHINHEYDDSFPFLPYAFPGTRKDSLRDISESFNISHHGLFILFDKDGNIIRSENGN